MSSVKMYHLKKYVRANEAPFITNYNQPFTKQL